MNSTNPELSWKPVTKGRRTQKSVARSLNSVVKAGNSISPKRVGDFSGSDSDKFGEVIIGQATSGKSENVPLKKRRHLLQSPSPHPWTSSLPNKDSAPKRTRSCSPLLEDHVQLQYPNCSSGDFSGIELLAAAASMDADIDDADKKDIVPDDTTIQKNSDASSSATRSEQGSKNNKPSLSNIDVVGVNVESQDDTTIQKNSDASSSATQSEQGFKNNKPSLSNLDVVGANVESQDNNSAAASRSLLTGCPEDDTMPKVSREYWDLNTPMDAWGEPCDDSIAGGTVKDVNEGMHEEESENHFADQLLAKPTGTPVQTSSLKVVEVKSTSVSEDGICSVPPLEQNLHEPPNVICPHIARDILHQSCEEDPDCRNSIQASNCASEMKTLNQVTSSDVNIGSSPFSMLVSEDKNNGTMLRDEDSSCNISECERSAALDGSHAGSDEVNTHDTTASESAIVVQPKDIEVFKRTSDLPGTFTIDAQPIASTDSNKQIDGSLLSSSTIADCKQYSEVAEHVIEHDGDSNLPKSQSKRAVVEYTSKSCSAAKSSKGPTTVETIGLVLEGQHNSGVSGGKHVDVVDGDDSTGFKEGYDSPYEDGELRGSCLYSWEENEMENESVDYESDGRNGAGSDTADYYHGSEIVEGGSEGSHGTQRNLSLKLSPEDKSKSGPVNHSFNNHIVTNESDNNEIVGKGSNAGSGSTVEQCVEMTMESNDGMRRLQLLDHKDSVNVRVTRIEEYASKSARGKLQSRIEGRSSADGTDVKDAFFIQQSRSRRLADAYPRPERDASPDRYLGRYRSAVPGERDGVHQWASWGSRRRYTTNYQGGEGRNHTRPRSKTGESANKIDRVDYHESRQNNYLPKGLHKPFMRRSPVERDEYFGVGRRIPMTRGGGNFRGRGRYSMRPSRDFVEEFEPLPEDAGPPVRMPRNFSRREHSFSPCSGRQTHMPVTRRRSRSRSRTRSPRAWHPQRERTLGARRLSRSPDFRSEARMERMRMHFPKSTFPTDYGEDYISPARGRFSPQRNSRWVEERNFADSNNLRRRRSPVSVFRRTQRFDDVGSSGRMKSEEYFRPMMRPGRFSFMGNGGREYKLDSNYDDRRRDDSGETSHRGVHPDDVRRFRQNAVGGDFEAKKLNSEEAPQSQQQQQLGEREDKKAALKI